MTKDEFLKLLRSGEFDADLVQISAAVNARAKAIAPQAEDFIEGQTVRISNKANPKYLRGAMATVRQINRTRVVLDLQEPRGRFHKGVITPPSLIEVA